MQLEFFDLQTEAKTETPRHRFIAAYNKLQTSSEELNAASSDPLDPEHESILMIDRLCDAAIAAGLSDQAGILINSSTGKDSTLVTQIVLTCTLRRKRAGKAILPIFVGIADTASEFVMMADRMKSECAALNKFGKVTGLALEAEIVQPPPNKRLLVEIVGRGLGLPHLKSGTTNGMAGASWCMDRVKRGPLETVFKQAQKKFPFLIQCVGVRSAESSRRAGNIKKHAGELPDGLTELGNASPNHIGATPIRHWSDHEVRDWMSNHLPPWNPEGSDELRRIYSAGANPGGESGECQLTVAKDGSLTNVCSDLGGTRFGCWHCLLSKNKSLANIARRDRSYKPLRRVHAYIFGHHKRGDKRRDLRELAGFDAIHMFPKGFTLRERFFMAMLLARAEQESGHTLLAPEEITAIEGRWAANGYPQLTFGLARAAAETWRKTGIPLGGWESSLHGTHAGVDIEPDTFCEAFETPLPFAAWAHLPQTNGLVLNTGRAPDILNLLSAAGAGEELFPTLRAWVVVPPSRGSTTRHILTVISDHLATLAGRTQGMVTGHWQVVGNRAPLPWERKLSDGRVIFHAIPDSIKPDLTTLQGRAMLANYESLDHCDGTRHWENHMLESQRIAGCNITPEELDQLMQDVAVANWEAETVAHAVHQAKERLAHWNERNGFALPDHPAHRTNASAQPKSSSKLGKVRQELREIIEAANVHKAALEIQERKKLACQLLLSGRINRSLLNRLNRIVPWIGVDPNEFELEFNKIATLLKLPHLADRKPSPQIAA
jgi:3'-phosphoadenosine 5'-phosphosulfate sulfotransferase (PAPS reductase)/FAD synthetase